MGKIRKNKPRSPQKPNKKGKKRRGHNKVVKALLQNDTRSIIDGPSTSRAAAANVRQNASKRQRKGKGRSPKKASPRQATPKGISMRFQKIADDPKNRIRLDLSRRRTLRSQTNQNLPTKRLQRPSLGLRRSRNREPLEEGEIPDSDSEDNVTVIPAKNASGTNQKSDSNNKTPPPPEKKIDEEKIVANVNGNQDDNLDDDECILIEPKVESICINDDDDNDEEVAKEFIDIRELFPKPQLDTDALPGDSTITSIVSEGLKSFMDFQSLPSSTPCPAKSQPLIQQCARNLAAENTLTNTEVLPFFEDKIGCKNLPDCNKNIKDMVAVQPQTEETLTNISSSVKRKPEEIDLTNDETNDVQTMQPNTGLEKHEILPFFEDKTALKICPNNNSKSPEFLPFSEDKTLANNRSADKDNNAQGKNTEKIDLTNDDADIIVLDDTLPELTRVRATIDDSSLIILDETFGDQTTIKPAEDFIPLHSSNVPNPMHSPPSHKTPKKRRLAPDIFTNSERKQLNVYSDNAYNPNAEEQQKGQKRKVIIDGSNVAYAHGLSQEFSVKGIKICLEYFEKLGHECKIVVPLYRQNPYKSSEPHELERLHKEGKVVFTPCKNINGKTRASYDDRFILQLACQLDAVVVSNDGYRDLVNENSAFKKLIENRVIGYTWCDDIFIVPKDPYGRFGPSLREILNRY